MEFRTQKTACLLIGLWLAAVMSAQSGISFSLSRAGFEDGPDKLKLIPQQNFKYDVRHQHLRKGCTGTLLVNERGVSYQEISKKKKKHLHAWEWSYQDIQQLEVSPRELRVLTYKDNPWKLGADREYGFRVLGERRLLEVYALLKDRLDQRLVAALADPGLIPLWQIPAKHLGRISGSEGLLIVGRDRIIYSTARPGDSRTWRYKDIENISTSGPFQLTLTTYERAKSHYGSLKGFNFQLKAPLSEDRYNDLWRRLNQNKGLKFLTSISEQETRQ